MITTLTGENDVSRSDALRQIVARFLAEHGDMGLERLDGEEASYERMHEAAQSLPFLAPKKLVVLYSPSASKEFIEHFEQFLGDIPETNDVLLVEPRPDKRTGYYKHLQKLTDFQEFKLLDGPALQRYLSDYAQQQGGGLTIADARTLIDRVGTNQLTLQHEIDKLVAYSPKIDRSSIELLTEKTPQSSVFELLDAALSGNAQLALRLYKEQREQKSEPQQIIAMLIWQLHVLAIVKTATGKSPDTVAREAKLNPFTVRKTAELARRMSLRRLKELVSDLREFDVRLKSEGLNADEVVQFYLLDLAAGGN